MYFFRLSILRIPYSIVWFLSSVFIVIVDDLVSKEGESFKIENSFFTSLCTWKCSKSNNEIGKEQIASRSQRMLENVFYPFI